jgi:hypothetical protein
MFPHQQAMYNDEINAICANHPLLSQHYVGCFSRDQLNNKITSNASKNNKCFIVNNQTIKNGGEHWIAVWGNTVYDSFGRNVKRMNAKFQRMFKGFKNAKRNDEQFILEANCGQRCIVYLILCAMYGSDEVIKFI